jgi:hypothetical protein
MLVLQGFEILDSLQSDVLKDDDVFLIRRSMGIESNEPGDQVDAIFLFAL